MVKKAFMKTIEMLIVIVLSAIFLIMLLSKPASLNQAEVKDYFIKLEENEEFRQYIQNTTGCFNSSVDSPAATLLMRYMTTSYDYLLCSGTVATSAQLPPQTVYIDSLVFTGNYTDTRFKKLSLYYWLRQ
ncbi:TPA: hypothetical protein HA239_02475 [Candidatus Woesearchaeota archaeon]|nr:hypothetical protein QT06_C0001G1097 [archaeon GW2011_AR15]MBS3104432.1 hypothetical protein [Candidatus Woesearchaeota archaeon]HIH41255.1 hypothetical protein [Candidatus Woesearchaeota archaeon]